ncbi:chemotaxis protein CheW [Phormidium sp. CCY1219]|uniref:chemotaxis protein CheW n=1 Tax=Phormidium sp. CCY1219 TaxID=2886104 RepID=UPI002D1F265D|nr:chemotaxis protein CheW [Phormidium sp. CCY1219]MEB3828953.1 chemotaxis protein CheW [Phormidium sp. CCY1219]
MTNDKTQAMGQECWNEIGIGGDRSCPELERFIHCHNCPVYSQGGRSLLDREAPAGYREEWTELVREETVTEELQAKTLPSQLTTTPVEAEKTVSVAIFRLGIEWLALPAFTFKEVTPPCAIHTLPHRSNEILLGLVNIRGEILTCISMHNFLGVETQSAKKNSATPKPQMSPIVYSRMVVVEIQGNPWVFPVDEIDGIHRLDVKRFQEVPAVLSKSTDAYTQAIIQWQNKKVNCLDYERVFSSVKRRTL